MNIFKFINPSNGAAFQVRAPAAMSEAQAKLIFDQQINSGSLVGMGPGELLSAGTQAAGGLTSALSQVTQAAAGIPGSINGAIPGSLTGVQSLAKTVINTTNTAIKSGGTSPYNINVSDYAKQETALLPSTGGSLDTSDMTGCLAQAGKLSGQTADQVSDSAGAGKYGLDSSQLESAGLLKPGTTSKFISGTTNSLTSVLQSPSVWTGKDGIKSLDNFLASPSVQSLSQQKLMNSGLTSLAEAGLPIDKLNPTAISGLALNSAKSVTDTINWAKNLPLPPSVKSAFNLTAQLGAFATNFSGSKINDALRGIELPIPAVDTVSRESLNAASTRVIGNPKVPPVNYTAPKDPPIDPTTYLNKIRSLNANDTITADWAKIKRAFVANPNSGPEYITQLEQLKGEVDNLESSLAAIERQGNYFVQQTGANPYQSSLDVKRQTYQEYYQLIDALIADIRLYMQQSAVA